MLFIGKPMRRSIMISNQVVWYSTRHRDTEIQRYRDTEIQRVKEREKEKGRKRNKETAREKAREDESEQYKRNATGELHIFKNSSWKKKGLAQCPASWLSLRYSLAIPNIMRYLVCGTSQRTAKKMHYFVGFGQVCVGAGIDYWLTTISIRGRVVDQHVLSSRFYTTASWFL